MNFLGIVLNMLAFAIGLFVAQGALGMIGLGGGFVGLFLGLVAGAGASHLFQLYLWPAIREALDDTFN